MGKLIALIYGLFAYLLAVGSTGYAVGFLGNFLVPKSVDSGTVEDWPTAVAVDLLLLGLFAVQHSVMARPAFKEWVTGLIPPAVERSTYVLLSGLALGLLYWQWRPLTHIVWEVENGIGAAVLTGLFFLGWGIAGLSTFLISHFELMGLQQVFDQLKGRITPNLAFRVTLLYRLVRHPLMLGLLIAFWATPVMTVGHLLFAGVNTVYIVLAVRYLEERDLRDSIGEAYAEYQRRVPMLLPLPFAPAAPPADPFRYLTDDMPDKKDQRVCDAAADQHQQPA